MRVSSLRRLAALLGAVGILAAGCSGGKPVRITSEAIDADAPQKAMELLDANKDGFLDDKELDQAPGLKAAKKQVDANMDGKISAEEIAARIKSWRESGIGRMGVACRITHNGRPLAGATVTFVPEAFLGRQLSSGSGTTDAQGIAYISASEDLPGMSPGFYRVQITKTGEDIPVRYNTQTTLGQEVSGDAEGVNSGSGGGITFELKY